MGVGAEDDLGAGREARRGERLLAGFGLGVELGAPVEEADDDVGAAAGCTDVGRDRAQVGAGGAGARALRGEAERVHVRVAEEGDPDPAGLDERRAARRGGVRPGADRLHPGRADEAKVSSSAPRPKSTEWLLASVSTSKPAKDRIGGSASGGPRNAYSFSAAAPALEIDVSRFPVVMSALRSVPATAAQG